MANGVLMGGLVAAASVLAGCFVFCLHRWFRSSHKVVPSPRHQHAPARRIRPREKDDERTRLLKTESSEESSENGESGKKEPADASGQLLASSPLDGHAIDKPLGRAEVKASQSDSASTRRDRYGSTETEAAKPAAASLVVTTTAVGGKKDERSCVVDVDVGLVEPARSKEDGRGGYKAENSTVCADVEPALIDMIGDVFSAPMIPPTSQGEHDRKEVNGFPGTVSSAKTDLEASTSNRDSVAGVLIALDQEEGKAEILFTKRVESTASPTPTGSAPGETAKESAADKVTTLTQPAAAEARREEQEASEDAQTPPRLPPPPKLSPKPSPLARVVHKATPSPQVAPKPSPQVAPKPSPQIAPKPSPRTTTSTPVAPDKPVVQPRKLPKGAVSLFPGGVPVFPVPKGAVPVLPVGGLRKTAQGNGDSSSELSSSDRLRAGPWMGNGRSATGAEGERELGVSFEEPIKAPDLYSPSKDRVRGPANRRRPSRH